MRHRLVVIVDSAKLGDAIKAITPYALVHVEVKPAEDGPEEARARRTRGSRPVQETRLGRKVLDLIGAGTRFDADLSAALAADGFAPSSLSSTTSALRKAGLVVRSGPNSWHLTPPEVEQ